MDPPTRLEMRKARIGVTVIFFICGAAGAVWYTRLADVMVGLRLTPTELAVVLLTFAAGAFVAMQVAGPVIDRFGSRTVLRVASPITAACLIPLGMAGWFPHVNESLLPLFQILPPAALTGFWYGLMDVAMNAQGVVVEGARRKAMMGSFHAAFSVGYAAGGGVGVITVGLGWTHHQTLIATGIACLVLCGFATYPLLNWGQSAASDHDLSEPVKLSRPLLMLGLLAMTAFITEGAAVEWGGTYLRNRPIHASQLQSAWSIFMFTAFMAVARVMADPLRKALGSARMVRYGAAVAAVGLAINLIAAYLDVGHGPKVVTAMVAFALMGFGLAPAVPELFSAAGRYDPNRTGSAIAKVSALGYGGYLFGPAVMSQVVQHGKIGHIPGSYVAMTILVVLSIVVAVGAGAVDLPSERRSIRPSLKKREPLKTGNRGSSDH